MVATSVHSGSGCSRSSCCIWKYNFHSVVPFTACGPIRTTRSEKAACSLPRCSWTSDCYNIALGHLRFRKRSLWSWSDKGMSGWIFLLILCFDSGFQGTMENSPVDLNRWCTDECHMFDMHGIESWLFELKE
jgi:hypothetical protein